MMTAGVIFLFLLFLVIAFIVIQGTRAAFAWRDAAARGDVKVISEIVEGCLKGWSSQRRPKPVPVEIWRGVQSMQLVYAEADFVQVSALADSEYKQVDGRAIEMRNPLQIGIEVTARAADMLFYELPHYQPARIQIDVYTEYRDQAGVSRRECILSTYTNREHAKQVDWDEWTADEIVASMDGRYRLSDTGRPLPIDPIKVPKVKPPVEETPKIAEAHG